MTQEHEAFKALLEKTFSVFDQGLEQYWSTRHLQEIGTVHAIGYGIARLLERSTHLRDEFGDGSLTTLPIVETEAQSLSAYIPTHLISITDGQIYLSPDLFQKGILPAVDVGKSVSRIGGKTQLAAYRAVAGNLRLSYSQFEELEAFARFGTQLDEDTRQTLERGRRVREVLKQSQYEPMPIPEQIAVLLAVNEGIFDTLSPEAIAEAEQAIWQAVKDACADISERLQSGETLSDADRQALLQVLFRQQRQPAIIEELLDIVSGFEALTQPET